MKSHALTSSSEPKAGSRLLSLQQASAFTGIPSTSLRDIVFRGDLPIVRIPNCRRWWFDRRDLEQAIERWRERLGEEPRRPARVSRTPQNRKIALEAP